MLLTTRLTLVASFFALALAANCDGCSGCGCSGCGCSSRRNLFQPLNKFVGTDNCAATILSKQCEFSAVDEKYFETNVHLKLPPDFPQTAQLEIRLCKRDGTPINGWEPFFADRNGLERLLRGEKREGFVAFRTDRDNGRWIVKILEEFMSDENPKRPRNNRTAMPPLDRKLRECGAERFSLDVICQ